MLERLQPGRRKARYDGPINTLIERMFYDVQGGDSDDY